MNETKNTIDYHQHQNTSELANLRETIDKLTATLEGSVLKLVIKRFTETISSLVSEVRDLKKAEAEISKRVSVSFENIHDIKEVIGRKANYADIIGLFEKKASKEDVILIKDILNNSDMGIQMEDVSANTKKPRRLGDSSRLKTSVVRSSNKYSTDRSLSSSIPVGSSFDKIKNQARLISKRFQYRPDTAELSIFNWWSMIAVVIKPFKWKHTFQPFCWLSDCFPSLTAIFEVTITQPSSCSAIFFGISR